MKGIGEEWTRDGERVAARREICKVARIEKRIKLEICKIGCSLWFGKSVSGERNEVYIRV